MPTHHTPFAPGFQRPSANKAPEDRRIGGLRVPLLPWTASCRTETGRPTSPTDGNSRVESWPSRMRRLFRAVMEQIRP